MPVIYLETLIAAPAARCFDLSRSIDLHQLSTAATQETAVAGITEGLINLNQEVTWRAKHFGIWQHLTSKITAFERPTYFVDEMVQGSFRRFHHTHSFKYNNELTTMQDIFDYTSPLGILGKLADKLFLKKYMTQLLQQRNLVIKAYAESERWQEVLPQE
ncbi:SRPBCC family protein [Pontibacter akesuensis]|uniref:Ligand-binding SRPBCC domain-containing protein n=1 Tax=Pontibacter akesuensis TaxID=388950 RepID=A0A1I7G0D8_9BACT|nr:SRPBCC family protein [Pontibacter akesuensis]GHA59627.1 hypothetical protein GCM10007389_09580 [Pontibacter akesuensis]SFU41766.1 hypothetical protein SAMN04487941_0605 [Pontibacter akesuensis]